MKRLRSLVLLCVIFLTAFCILSLHLIKNKNTSSIRIIEGHKAISVHMTRLELAKQIAAISLEDFLSQTKIAVAGDDKGLELVDFKKGNPLVTYGFKKGDIIRSINGSEVRTIKEALMACDSLEKEVCKDTNEKEVNISLVRDNEDVDMNFAISSFVPEKVHYTMRLEKNIGK